MLFDHNDKGHSYYTFPQLGFYPYKFEVVGTKLPQITAQTGLTTTYTERKCWNVIISDAYFVKPPHRSFWEVITIIQIGFQSESNICTLKELVCLTEFRESRLCGMEWSSKLG